MGQVLHKISDPELKDNRTHTAHDLDHKLCGKMAERVRAAFKRSIAESERMAAESIEKLQAASSTHPSHPGWAPVGARDTS